MQDAIQSRIVACVHAYLLHLVWVHCLTNQQTQKFISLFVSFVQLNVKARPEQNTESTIYLCNDDLGSIF